MARFDAERHHRRSVRLPGYDYGAGGMFFVTICAWDRMPLFGVVDRGAMRMNECGWIVWEEWERSAAMRPGMGLVAHVVMPNHMHALFTLPPHVGAHCVRPTPSEDAVPETARRKGPAEGARSAPLRRPAGSLGSFIAGFKASCTRQINAVRNVGNMPVWQRGYWEHIVRDEDASSRIYEYIETNPLRWERDCENPDFIGDDPFHAWMETVAPAIVAPV